MAKSIDLYDLINPDDLGCRIAVLYQQWETLRSTQVAQWEEIQRYVFATDTTQTSNAKLPWSNKTVTPKLCQIRDNLHANYMAALFPKRHWLEWQGETKDDNSYEKAEAIENYIKWTTDRNEFYNSVSRCILDYIDYGNCFATVVWKDEKSGIIDDSAGPRQQTGYSGPAMQRISPLDIVFDPTAVHFSEAPKIIRSIVSLGSLKEIIDAESATLEDKTDAIALWDYLLNLRGVAADPKTNIKVKDALYNIAGFTDFKTYLGSQNAEVLTFYGDIYDDETHTLYKNYIIKVVDRHKIIVKRPNESIFGYPPIFHVGWRMRPDNIWAMGPLDNLVGMQYRIDHLENIKADLFDLVALPPVKVKGYVEDFEWGPLEKIYVGDDGDVELMSPRVEALNADNQIAILEAKMEEMAGSPKEAMGFRTPGEKTMYEVQRLELAAGRIFQSKTSQFERDFLEQLLNGFLELARRNMTETTINIFNDQYQIQTFKTLSAEDITGVGRLRPVAARHFAEKATMVQNLNNFFGSAAGQDPEVRQHFSAVKLAKAWECLLDADEFKLVEPYVRLIEQLDAKKLINTVSEQMAIEQQTAGGILPGDHDASATQGLTQTNEPTVPGQPGQY